MSAGTGLPFVTGDEVRRRIGPDDARRLVERALADGFDPAADPARSSVAAGAGHLLLMPSVLGDWAGVKIASVAPGNPARWTARRPRRDSIRRAVWPWTRPETSSLLTRATTPFA